MTGTGLGRGRSRVGREDQELDHWRLGGEERRGGEDEGDEGEEGDVGVVRPEVSGLPSASEGRV